MGAAAELQPSSAGSVSQDTHVDLKQLQNSAPDRNAGSDGEPGSAVSEEALKMTEEKPELLERQET